MTDATDEFTRSRPRIAGVTVALVAVVGAVLWLIVANRGPALSTAASFARTSTFVGERGKPHASCRHGGLLGLGANDVCTVTFASGDAFHCSIVSAPEAGGVGGTCDSRPFRRGGR
jgi:hypothetical protein